MKVIKHGNKPGTTLPGLRDFEIPSKVKYNRFGDPDRVETKDEEIDRLSKSMHPENILKGMTQAGAMHKDPEHAQEVRTQIQKKLISMGTRLNELTPNSDRVRTNTTEGIKYLNDPKNSKGMDEKTFKVLTNLHLSSSLATEGSSSIDKENYRETTQGSRDLGFAVGAPAALAAGFFGVPAMLPSFLARGAQGWAATTAMFGAGNQALKYGGDALGLKDQDLARAPEGFAEGLFMGNLIAPLTNPIMGGTPLRYLQKPIQAAFGIGSAWAASEGNYKQAGFLASGMGIGLNPRVPTRQMNKADLRGTKLDWPARKPAPKKLPFDGLVKKIEAGLSYFLGKPGKDAPPPPPPTPSPSPSPSPSPTPTPESAENSQNSPMIAGFGATGTKPTPTKTNTGFGRAIQGGARTVGSMLRIPANFMDAVGLTDPNEDDAKRAQALADIEKERQKALEEKNRIAKEKEEAEKKAKEEAARIAAEEAAKVEATKAAEKAAEKAKREEEERVRLAAVATENARKIQEEKDIAEAVKAKEKLGKKDPPAPVAEPPTKVENPNPQPPKESILRDIIPWLGLAAIQKESMAFPTMVSGIPTASAPSFEKTQLDILYYTEAGL